MPQNEHAATMPAADQAPLQLTVTEGKAEKILKVLEPFLDCGDSRFPPDWAVEIARILAAEPELPPVTAQFEVVTNGITGSQPAPVKRVDLQDDGTLTVVLDYWPPVEAGTPPVAGGRLPASLMDFAQRVETGCRAFYGERWLSMTEGAKESARGYMSAALRAVSSVSPPARYFAARPSEGEFNVHDTLEQARADAQEMLDYEGEDGWSDEPPQICYGLVLAECAEVAGSRRPAPEGSDFSEIVEFELVEITALASLPPGGPADAERYRQLLGADWFRQAAEAELELTHDGEAGTFERLLGQHLDAAPRAYSHG